MSGIHEEATLTSKGQLTLPRAIRQFLGVSTGSKVVFEVRGDQIIVSRATDEEDDPALESFLHLLEADIRKGHHIQALPEDLASAMLASLGQNAELDEDIEGDVDI